MDETEGAGGNHSRDGPAIPGLSLALSSPCLLHRPKVAGSLSWVALTWWICRLHMIRPDFPLETVEEACGEKTTCFLILPTSRC